jgi:hypothetical protein
LLFDAERRLREFAFFIPSYASKALISGPFTNPARRCSF